MEMHIFFGLMEILRVSQGLDKVYRVKLSSKQEMVEITLSLADWYITRTHPEEVFFENSTQLNS
jgi:hypothetical protein